MTQPTPAGKKMSLDRFNELCRGPLNHPLMQFVVTRLSMALWDVVDTCGAPAAEALERHCRARQERDESW